MRRLANKVRVILKETRGESLMESVVSTLVFTVVITCVMMMMIVSMRITSAAGEADKRQHEANAALVGECSCPGECEYHIEIDPPGDGNVVFKIDVDRRGPISLSPIPVNVFSTDHYTAFEPEVTIEGGKGS